MNEIDLISYALWIAIKAVGITVMISIAIWIVIIQYQEKKSKVKRNKLTYRSFKGLDVKRYMITSKLWHIEAIMHEYGYKYQAHHSTNGLISYIMGPCCFVIYLKTLKWKCTIRRAISISGQLENLKDLREIMDYVTLEVNLYEEKGKYDLMPSYRHTH